MNLPHSAQSPIPGVGGIRLVGPRQDPDAELVAQAQSGKLEAFEELVRRHSKLVYRALTAILGNPADAQDAMQDTFLRAFKHLGGFQGRSKFSTWLVSIARNTALLRLRGGKFLRAWTKVNATMRGTFALVRSRPGRTTRSSAIRNQKCGSWLKRAFWRFPQTIALS